MPRNPGHNGTSDTKPNRQKMDHDSDHFPIATKINLRIPQTTRASIRRWKKMDGKVFQKTLQEKLPKLKRLSIITSLDCYTEKVARAIRQAAQATPRPNQRRNKARNASNK
jgi:arsenate reductase-like glutaredoxin family protein